MKNQKELMIDNSNSRLRLISVACRGLTWLSAALVLGGCGKPEARPPEKALVRTAVVESTDDARSDGEASYLASVRFDHETDLSFKVGGILVTIGSEVARHRLGRGNPGESRHGACGVEAGGLH